MSNLFVANFIRLVKSKRFFISMLVLLVFEGFCVFTQNHEITTMEAVIPLDEVLTIGMEIMGFVLAVLFSIFIGMEFSDGTIRNKIIIGKTRAQIYLSTLLCGILASTILYVFGVGVMALLGYLFLSPAMYVPEEVFIAVLTGWVSCISFTAIFVMIGMCVANRSAIAITSLVVAFVLLAIGVTIQSTLQEPEFITQAVAEDGVYDADVEAGAIEIETVSNPYYATGTKRTICEYVMATDPYGVAFHSIMHEQEHWQRTLALQGLVTLLMSSMGVLIFRKKDIK